MRKILVVVEDYPDNNGKVTLMYVHTRNKFYMEHGFDVSVLNFRADKKYAIDNIPVITLEDYEKQKKEYDILICHAPNIRNHYRFLKKHGEDFPKFVFFFHGHEVLKINKTYSKPYPYVRNSKIKSWLQDRYDDFKLSIWRKYYPSVKEKSKFVFVSHWMLDEFLKWTKIPYDEIKDCCEITYNCIGKVFEETVYDTTIAKEYDFLTIRSFLNGSKYCIDLVNQLAFSNPNKKFLLVGKGEFFDHYEKAPNLIWMNRTMNHSEIIEYMQKSRCALMPTRTDAQGLMMCEMASTGMPLITSDIPVCHEVFNEFDNVALIDNVDSTVNLDDVLIELEKNIPYQPPKTYYNINTSQNEVALLCRIGE